MRHGNFDLVKSQFLKAILVVGLLSAPAWGAPTIGTLTLPAAVPNVTSVVNGNLTQVTTVNCNIPPVTVGCTDTAFVSTTLANTNSVFLQGSFNGTAPPLVYPVNTTALTTAVAGGPLNGVNVVYAGYALPVNITVTTFGTYTPAGETFAGMTLAASVAYIPTVAVGPPNPGNPNNVAPPAAGSTALPNLNQLVWTQITYDNYFAPSTKNNPATLLDSYKNNGGTGGPPPPKTKKSAFNQACIPLPAGVNNGAPATVPAGGAGAGRAYCDPIYPFQSRAGAASFFDRPTGPWAVPASFRAIDFLSSLSVVNGVTTLTIYNNGINYGFDLKTPEPGFFVVLFTLSSLLIVVLSRRRRVKSL